MVALVSFLVTTYGPVPPDQLALILLTSLKLTDPPPPPPPPEKLIVDESLPWYKTLSETVALMVPGPLKSGL
jgi:hypothetical protein